MKIQKNEFRSNRRIKYSFKHPVIFFPKHSRSILINNVDKIFKNIIKDVVYETNVIYLKSKFFYLLNLSKH
jgi:hypothetical protein